MKPEDYCSEELTKLLLEKGCPLEKVRRQDGRPVYFTLPTDHPRWPDCDVYYIPTHAQVMKWLREKDIDTIIMPLFKLKEGRIYCYEIHSDNTDVRDGRFDTYEEAVEAAIKYSLENLI